MKLSVNHSEALVKLILTNQVRVDAIEWVDKLNVAEISSVRQQLPDIAFHFHQGRILFSKQAVSDLKEYLTACPQTEAVSIHLAPLPALVTFPALRWKLFLPEPNTQTAIERFIRQVRWLQARLDLPVILENMPALHPTRYRFESEPGTMRSVLEATGCRMLLDLAHARVAAEVRNIPVKDYLSQLPLELTQQIHLAGVRRDAKTDRLYDAHQSLADEDYELLAWVLTQIQPQLVTLEYFREDAKALKTQLERLRPLRQILF